MTKLKDKDRTLIDLTKIVAAQTGTWVAEYGRGSENRESIILSIGTHTILLNYYNAADRDHDYELMANRDMDATTGFAQ
jgi:hypothetical protein